MKLLGFFMNEPRRVQASSAVNGARRAAGPGGPWGAAGSQSPPAAGSRALGARGFWGGGERAGPRGGRCRVRARPRRSGGRGAVGLGSAPPLPCRHRGAPHLPPPPPAALSLSLAVSTARMRAEGLSEAAVSVQVSGAWGSAAASRGAGCSGKPERLQPARPGLCFLRDWPPRPSHQ